MNYPWPVIVLALCISLLTPDDQAVRLQANIRASKTLQMVTAILTVRFNSVTKMNSGSWRRVL